MDRVRSRPVRMCTEQALRVRKGHLGVSGADLRQGEVIAEVRILRRAVEQQKKKPFGLRQTARVQMRESELSPLGLVLRQCAYCLKTAEPLTNCPVFVVSL